MLINQNPKYLITFVHGTWGRNSRWTQSGSDLHKLLSDHYGQDCIRNFEWSGRNSHKARLNAGKRLSKALKNNINSYPQANHFIVSHSHGGNVVLYALRDQQIQKMLSGVMCMGTPFIHCQPRDISESLGVISYFFSSLRFLLYTGLVLGLCAGPLFLLVAFKDISRRGINFRVTITITILVFTVALAYFSVERIASLRERLHRWAERRQMEVTQRLSLPDPKALPFPIYCVRSKGDEAYVGLKISRVFGDLPYRFWRPGFQAIIIVIVALATAILSIRLPTVYLGNLSPFFIGSIAKTFIATYSAVAISFQLLMLCLPFISFSQFVFGGERVLDSWFTQITVSATPTPADPHGDKTGLSLLRRQANNVYYKTYSISGRCLRHCLIYTNKDFLRDVENLIHNRFSTP